MERSRNGRPEVLVLVQDEALAEGLRTELESAGFVPDVTTDPDRAEREATRGSHEAYVVDVSMAEGAGSASPRPNGTSSTTWSPTPNTWWSART